MHYLFILLLLCSFSTFGQSNVNQKIIAQSDSVRLAMPREKIYVHFDKSVYLSSDTIWFKAYLTNASSNGYSQVSGLIYAEIIDEKGEVMNTLALPTALGVTWGSFALAAETYTSGRYTFRAYSNWMHNFGDSHIFKKEFQIINGEDEQKVLETLAVAHHVSNVNTPKKTTEIEVDIQFLPEGGKWLVGVPQKMAVKALNKHGIGMEINGEIFDSKQNKITDFYSNPKGMGYFTITAQPNERYIAKVRSKLGTIKDQQLLSPVENGTALSVENSFGSDSLSIQIFSTIPYQDFTIIGQSRGMICFLSNVKSRVIKISKSVFPTGVSQILLLDKNNQKLNERSFFVNHHQELKIDLSPSSIVYHQRDSISIQLNVVDDLKNPSTGSFSVAVTADDQVGKDRENDENILSYFLLSSDLKGKIENPNFYFHQQDSIKHHALEALMLTQGWVSYDWELNKKPIFKAQKEYTISGRIGNILKKPSANAKIIMLGSNKSLLLMETQTNKNGEFVFDNLPLLDSASVVLQVRNQKGRLGTLTFDVDELNRPLTPINKLKKTSSVVPTDSISAQLIENQKQEDFSMYGIRLKEVKIVGKRTVKGTRNLAGTVIQTITEQQLDKVAKVSLYQALQDKIKGFQMRRMGYSVHISPAKFIFDGLHLEELYNNGNRDDYMFFLKSSLDYYSAEDVRRIDYVEVMTKDGPVAYIEINTKTGAGPFLTKSANLYLLKPVNYGSTAAFYSPKYTAANITDKKPDYRSTVFWAPNLLTDNNGKAEFSFFSADKKGTYTVWVEGSDMQGNFGMQTLKLEIK